MLHGIKEDLYESASAAGGLVTGSIPGVQFRADFREDGATPCVRKGGNTGSSQYAPSANPSHEIVGKSVCCDFAARLVAGPEKEIRQLIDIETAERHVS